METDFAHPLGIVDVAQAARPFFDIRLYSVHLIAAMFSENRKPFGPFLEQKIGCQEMGAKLSAELFEKVFVAAQKSGVQQRG